MNFDKKYKTFKIVSTILFTYIIGLFVLAEICWKKCSWDMVQTLWGMSGISLQLFIYPYVAYFVFLFILFVLIPDEVRT